MDKAEAIERLEYLKAKAQVVLEQEVPDWIAEDVLGTIEAYDMAIEALQTEPNCSEIPNNSTVSKMEQVDKDINVRSKDEPQTDPEIAKAIVHKMIDDAVIAEDAYPDLRQKMHDAVDEYEPQKDCAWK